MTSNYLSYDRSIIESIQKPRGVATPKAIGGVALGIESLSTHEGCNEQNRKTLILEAGSDHPLLQVLDRHRARFVREKQWMPADHVTDFDEYDNPTHWTRSYVDTLTDEEGDDVIISSLRLTKLEQLGDCISLGMAAVDDPDTLPAEAMHKLRRAEQNGELYDLTRLTPPSKKVVTSEEYFDSVVKLIGYGVYQTAISSEEDPLWLFATTPGLHGKLNSLGMPNQPVAEIQRPGEKRTLLCFVHPLEALEYLVEHKANHERTYQNVLRGIEEARRTLSA